MGQKIWGMNHEDPAQATATTDLVITSKGSARMAQHAADLAATTTLQNAATATGNGTTLDVKGYGAAILQVTGTFSATITFEATLDGTNWVAVEATSLNDGSKSTTATSTGLFVVPTPGVETLRARISAYTSGSVTVVGRGFPGAQATLADVELNSSDVQIGAVEIKNATDDTRATVGANGLHVDVQALTSLPAGDNNIGNVDIASALPAGTNNIGDMDIESFEVAALTTMQNAATATGAGTVLDVEGKGSAIIEVSGTFTATIDFEVSLDDTTWHSVAGYSLSAGTRSTSTTSTGVFVFPAVPGVKSLRANISAYTSGSVTVKGRAFPAPLNGAWDVDVTVASSLPAGTNNIGDVDIASALPAGDNNIGNVDIASALPAGDNNIGNVDIASTIDLSTSTQTSSANTAQTITITAGASTPRVYMVEVAIKGAAAGNDINIYLKDGATTKWHEVIGSGASQGERVGFVTMMPIKGTNSQNMTLEVDAGGASVVTVANIGYTLT